MNARRARHSLIVIFAAALSVHVSGQAPSASGSSSSDGPPRRADGRPDLTGVWMPPYVPDMTVNKQDQRGYPNLPFTAWGLANWSSYDAASGDYTGSCFPFGLQR